MTDRKRIEELRRRVQMDPASVAFAGLAEEYRKAGRFKESVATCRAGLRRHPGYVSARVTLGRSLLGLGQWDEARQVLEDVIRIAPENLAAIRALAEIHDRLGNLVEPEPSVPEARPTSTGNRIDSGESTPILAANRDPAGPRPIGLSAPAESPPIGRPQAESAPLAPLQTTPRATENDASVLPQLESFLVSILRAREMLGRSGLSEL